MKDQFEVGDVTWVVAQTTSGPMNYIWGEAYVDDIDYREVHMGGINYNYIRIALKNKDNGYPNAYMMLGRDYKISTLPLEEWGIFLDKEKEEAYYNEKVRNI